MAIPELGKNLALRLILNAARGESLRDSIRNAGISVINSLDSSVNVDTLIHNIVDETSEEDLDELEEDLAVSRDAISDLRYKVENRRRELRFKNLDR